MNIKFTNYDDGIHHFEFFKNIDDLDLDDRFVGELKLNCKMDKSHHQIIIDCDLNFNTNLTCDRCITDFEKIYSDHFQNIYFISFEKDSDEKTEQPGIYYLSHHEDKIDLSNDVNEIIKLSLPMKVLCNDECKGLCPNCGKNLNENECNCKTNVENPVWEELKKIKKN
ncbi:MAG: DUF177 domain-containing protein [Bacteroidota bacterium]